MRNLNIENFSSNVQNNNKQIKCPRGKKTLTLSNPAMFLFSAKNSAGDSAKRKHDQCSKTTKESNKKKTVRECENGLCFRTLSGAFLGVLDFPFCGFFCGAGDSLLPSESISSDCSIGSGNREINDERMR